MSIYYCLWCFVSSGVPVFPNCICLEFSALLCHPHSVEYDLFPSLYPIHHFLARFQQVGFNAGSINMVAIFRHNYALKAVKMCDLSYGLCVFHRLFWLASVGWRSLFRCNHSSRAIVKCWRTISGIRPSATSFPSFSS